VPQTEISLRPLWSHLWGCKMKSIVGVFSAIPTCIISTALLLSHAGRPGRNRECLRRE
jgi:hypothetical protein